MSDWDFRLRHAAVWTAIDDLATQVGMSTSALAKACGYDSSAFSVSKRVDARGGLHWPSMGAVTAILEATDTSYGEFGALVDLIRSRMQAEPDQEERKTA